MPTAQQNKVSSSLLEEVDERALVDGSVDDPKATLVLISFYKTSKGTLWTLDEYCSSVVFPYYYYHYYYH